MATQVKHRIIASFLMIVFSMSTLAGFACSVGIYMGYNAHHHSHNGGHGHDGPKTHQKHQRSPEHSSIASLKYAGSNDDCCSNDVTKFSLLDKSLETSNLHLDVPVFLLAATITFFSQTINESGFAVNSKFQFVRRSSFLNDIDIQTAIRRFQI